MINAQRRLIGSGAVNAFLRFTAVVCLRVDMQEGRTRTSERAPGGGGEGEKRDAWHTYVRACAFASACVSCSRNDVKVNGNASVRTVMALCKKVVEGHAGSRDLCSIAVWDLVHLSERPRPGGFCTAPRDRRSNFNRIEMRSRGAGLDFCGHGVPHAGVARACVFSPLSWRQRSGAFVAFQQPRIFVFVEMTKRFKKTRTTEFKYLFHFLHFIYLGERMRFVRIFLSSIFFFFSSDSKVSIVVNQMLT